MVGAAASGVKPAFCQREAKPAQRRLALVEIARADDKMVEAGDDLRVTMSDMPWVRREPYNTLEKRSI
jgi:hypothetical protein